MKSYVKKIPVFIAIIVLVGFIGYKGFYARVHNQSNTPQNYEIGTNIKDLTIKSIVKDMCDFPNRFAGTRSNAKAVQYIRNYFHAVGLAPYFEDSYYHSFQGEYLKCSRYYMLNVNGTVENTVGYLKGKDSSKAIVISAHMDSYLGKGVLDNASGVAALLKTTDSLLHKLKSGDYPVDLIFVAFNAEECGLLGSEAFYKELTERYSDFYNINMDCVGAMDKPLAAKTLYENSQKLYQDFIPFLDKHQIPRQDIVYAAFSDGEPVGNSDNMIFQENGHAAIVLGDHGLVGYTNTRKDSTFDIIDYAELNRLADTVTDFVLSSNGKIY